MIQIHATAGKDPGVLFRRPSIEVSTDTPSIVTTLSDDATPGSVSITIQTTSEVYTNSLVTLSNVQVSRHVVTSATVGDGVQVVSLNPGVTSLYLKENTVVSVYTTQNAAILYDEHEDTFDFVRTNSLDIYSKHVRRPADVAARNMTLANGTYASYSDVQLQLHVLSTVPEVIPLTRTRGSYQVIVNGDTEDTPAASFFISKATSASADFSMFRVTSSPSSRGENIGLVWPPGQLLQLYHTNTRTAGNLSESVVYNIKFISNK